MNALEIHNSIAATPEPRSPVEEHLLDVLTMLNDRVSELERRIANTQAVANHANDAAAGLHQRHA